MSVLNDQAPTASLSTKLHFAFYALAMCDALGGPVEFQPRGAFATLTTMVPNHNFNYPDGLPAGSWTDDTSMALCLAESLVLAANEEGDRTLSKADVLMRWTKWWQESYLSSYSEGDKCFDIGNATQVALRIWRRYSTKDRYKVQIPLGMVDVPAFETEIGKALGGAQNCGNGSLMRVLPVALVYWDDTKQAVEVATAQSRLTHPHIMCQEACAVYVDLITYILQNTHTESARTLTKRDVLKRLANYTFTVKEWKGLFTWTDPQGRLGDHPLLKKKSAQISSSGYVLHTLEAVLWVFFGTKTFEEGAITCVNFGSDADTVAAIYGGIAGAWYGDGMAGKEVEGEAGEVWTGRVKGWWNVLVRREVVEKIVESVVEVALKDGGGFVDTHFEVAKRINAAETLIN